MNIASVSYSKFFDDSSSKIIFLRFKIPRHILLGIGVFIFSQPVLSCQGEDYKRTMEIVNYSYRVGMEVGVTGDFNLMLQKIQAINKLVVELPPSCQMLIQQLGGAYQSGGSASTTCSGGVCCDSTGCY